MYSYVPVCYWYVARMYSYLPVCYLYVLVCTCMLLVCTRMYSCGVLVTIPKDKTRCIYLHARTLFFKSWKLGSNPIRSDYKTTLSDPIRNDLNLSEIRKNPIGSDSDWFRIGFAHLYWNHYQTERIALNVYGSKLQLKISIFYVATVYHPPDHMYNPGASCSKLG